MGLIIQLSSLILMFVQSIIVPYLIGLESYGEAVLYLLPLFFIVAILETFYAKMMDTGYGGSILGVSIIFIFLTTLVNFYFLGISWKGFYLFLLTFFYVFSLAFKGRLYHEGFYRAIAWNEVASVLFYFISVVIFYNFTEGVYVYILSLLAYTILNSLLSFFSLKGGVELNFNFRFIRFLLGDILTSVFWKSYHIYVNIFLLFFVSLFYSNSFVAGLKIIFSVSYAVRFIAPFTLPMFFNSVKDNYLTSLKNIIKVQFFSIILSFFSFYIGRFLCEKFEILNSFVVVFEDIKIFLSYPMVVFSVYFGAFFVVLDKVPLFFLITSSSFLFIIISMYFGILEFDWAFLVSVAFYQISVLTCIYWFYRKDQVFAS